MPYKNNFSDKWRRFWFDEGWFRPFTAIFIVGSIVTLFILMTNPAAENYCMVAFAVLFIGYASMAFLPFLYEVFSCVFGLVIEAIKAKINRKLKRIKRNSSLWRQEQEFL